MLCFSWLLLHLWVTIVLLRMIVVKVFSRWWLHSRVSISFRFNKNRPCLVFTIQIIKLIHCSAMISDSTSFRGSLSGFASTSPFLSTSFQPIINLIWVKLIFISTTIHLISFYNNVFLNQSSSLIYIAAIFANYWLWILKLELHFLSLFLHLWKFLFMRVFSSRYWRFR